ncbi:MAG: GTP-binding protein [Gammaproteobacteria bacterium]|nr:GTP-binding protein [Gammaproteobacteria bacterium]
MIFKNIPTNLIIGFLGVGKTTVIRHLLSQVPKDQRWAVLVNEFGEVGVDGAFLREEDVAVEEVAGGCMCCVTGAGLQVGLNRLIRQYKPDRILIEPTGLGHPAQIIETLTTPPFAGVLDVRATIGLVDARQLSDRRYTEHPTYQDQLFIADALAANKADLSKPGDVEQFEALSREFKPAKLRYAMVEQGRIPLDWLDLSRSEARKALFPEAHAFIQAQTKPAQHEERAPATQWTRIENVMQGFSGCGWMIPADSVFSAEKLRTWINALPALRVKGVLHTDNGWMIFNRAGDSNESGPAGEQVESRIEIINTAPLNWTSLEQELQACENPRE